MKKILFLFLTLLFLSSPLYAIQSNVVDNTNNNNLSSTNDGNKQELNFISNGPEETRYYQFGAVAVDAPLIQAPSTIYDKEENWTTITSFPVITPDILYGKEELRKLLAEHKDIVQLYNGLRDEHINRPIYSMVRPSKGSVHLLTIKLTGPPNGIWEESFKRAVSLGYLLTNSHFIIPTIRKSIINKAASAGGSIPISSNGPIGSTASSIAASAQNSVSGVRPFDQYDIKIEFYSNNIINQNDMLMNAGQIFPSMNNVAKYYMVYFTDKSLNLSDATYVQLKKIARGIKKNWEDGSKVQVVGIGLSGEIDTAALVSEDIADKIGSYLRYDGLDEEDISDRMGNPLAMSAYNLPMLQILQKRNAIAAVQINILKKEVAP